MARHNSIGQWGEKIAQNYLSEKGYAILETNWRRHRDEVDIIAYNRGEIVFVEVKTRTSTEYGRPESFVDRKKQQAYIRMANTYMRFYNRDERVRFDIIAIVVDPQSGAHQIDHLEDAYSTAY